MGYDLHITRQSYWAAKEGPEIALEEWLAVVNSDPELTWSELNRSTSPYMADWSGPGKYPCWLDHDRGEIYTKNPTDEMTEKMVQIAKLLSAVVQGDDGEEYLEDGYVAAFEYDGQNVRRVLRRIGSKTSEPHTMDTRLKCATAPSRGTQGISRS